MFDGRFAGFFCFFFSEIQTPNSTFEVRERREENCRTRCCQPGYSFDFAKLLSQMRTLTVGENLKLEGTARSLVCSCHADYVWNCPTEDIPTISRVWRKPTYTRGAGKQKVSERLGSECLSDDSEGQCLLLYFSSFS